VQNRQAAVQRLVEHHGVQLLLVIGSPNSANSRRLCEVGLRAGALAAHLLPSADALDPSWLEGVDRVGVSAGASAPEFLVQDLVARLWALGASSVQTVELRTEDVTFNLPVMPDEVGSRQSAVGSR
jgi:4-hydroxy-3-methylbut-2-enyl diphosphate reductase